MRELDEKPELFNFCESYYDFIKRICKSQIAVENASNKLKIRVLHYEMLADFIFGMKDLYDKLQNISVSSQGLTLMADTIKTFVTSQEFKEIYHGIEKLNTIKEKVQNFKLVFNNAGGSNIVSVAIKDNAAAHGDQAKEQPGKGITHESITHEMSSLMDFLPVGFDWDVNVYQDIEYSTFEGIIIDKLQQIHPEFFHELEAFHAKYENYDMKVFIQMAEDMMFYISFIRFMKKLKKKGFKFTNPDICEELNKTEVHGAYDLTLAVKLAKEGRDYRGITCNDYLFDDENRFFILTGPNQGGKTTFLRSIGIIQVLAQAGCPVPAEFARISLTDHIFTHFTTAETVKDKNGRFADEMKRLGEILHKATSKSMILLNETFAGTRRDAAVEIACRIIFSILNKGCHGGYVTHFYEMYERLEGTSGVFSLLAEAVGKKDGSGIRTYKIIRAAPEGTGYALDIARKCGVTFEQLMELVSSGMNQV